MEDEGLSKFFGNRNLVSVVELMAQRYGLTPYQILTQMTLDEFSVNAAILVCGIEDEKQAHENATKGLKKMEHQGLPKGFERKVIKKSKPVRS